MSKRNHIPTLEAALHHSRWNQGVLCKTSMALTSLWWQCESASRISSTIRSERKEATVNFTSLCENQKDRVAFLFGQGEKKHHPSSFLFFFYSFGHLHSYFFKTALLRYNLHTIMLTRQSVQFNHVQYVYRVMHPSPALDFRAFALSLKETL